MAFSDRKIAEGLEHLRLGDKCMKTSLFKWKPDYDGAAAEYTKAGVAFKNAKAFEQAVNSYSKAAQAQRQNGSAFHAAKSLEAAALIHKEQGELLTAADLVEKASTWYLEHGTPDTAALALDRAGKMLEQKEPERAIDLYKKACEVSEAEDRPRQAAEFIGRAARLLIKQKKYDEALPVLKRECDLLSTTDNNGALNKLVLGLVLLHLHMGDYVAADKAMQAALREYAGFSVSEEAGPIERLLEAYDQGDQEEAHRILQSPLFKYMENAFTILARDLRVPGGGVAKPKSLVAEAFSDGQPMAAPDEEDEFSGGLC